jgi:outer membrane scaffolding protein for murein synthesis (MipA/OmpV family)
MRRVACLGLAACCLSSPAFSQSPAGNAELPSAESLASRDTLTIAVGVGVLPDYVGSNDYRILPVGAVRGQYKGISFSSNGSYLQADLVPRSGKVDFDLGPILGVRFNGRRHIDDPIVRLLPRTRTAIEVGGFAGVSLHGLTNPYDTLALHVDVLHDIGGAHRSTVIAPNVSFSTPLSRRTYASLSLGGEIVSNKFADYYFSVTPAGSLASGLPVFDARGGLKNWKLGLLLNQSVTGDLLHGLSVFGTVQYSRLLGDFKRSPIVSQRGSANQWLGAVGLAYTW